ncbi:MAG: hypothetical protein KDD53_03435 [Bdellovibrionales bacterium]|nr:hypothetical protein [Bdellovibrionales bacterium]
MGKIKSFPSVKIRKITGGKDPLRLVTDFIVRRGFDPDVCQKESSAENVRWMVPISNDEELEVLVEGLSRHPETSIYMGLNVTTVPVRNSYEMIVAALEIADGLVGIKVSLVGHYLVLSASFGASGMSIEDLDYHFELITAQKEWFRNALADELGLDELPDE